jgi:DeoR/GlpR family transcriptional regulator of sugar metabolism
MSAAILAAARREQILVEIAKTRCVNVTDLSRRFGVSYMTVRRDLDVLAKAGRLTRVHGGELPPSDQSATPISTRPRPTSGDVALAAIAARQIKPGTTVAIARGSRAYAFASFIAELPTVKVVTNSLWVAQLMQERHREASTLVTGGIGTPGGGLAGPALVSALNEVRIDTLVLDADGIDPRAGLTTLHFADAMADSTFVGAAARVVVLAPNAVWGTVNLCHVASLDAIDLVITDQLTARMRAELAPKVTHVISLRRLDDAQVVTGRPHPKFAGRRLA